VFKIITSDKTAPISTALFLFCDQAPKSAVVFSCIFSIFGKVRPLINSTCI